jgi:hypothetical protein
MAIVSHSEMDGTTDGKLQQIVIPSIFTRHNRAAKGLVVYFAYRNGPLDIGASGVILC